jgi:hypothetical protein
MDKSNKNLSKGDNKLKSYGRVTGKIEPRTLGTKAKKIRTGLDHSRNDTLSENNNIAHPIVPKIMPDDGESLIQKSTQPAFSQSSPKQGGQKGKRLPRTFETATKKYILITEIATALDELATAGGKSTALYLNEVLLKNPDILEYLKDRDSVPALNVDGPLLDKT